MHYPIAFVIALVFLLVSFIWSVYTREISASLFALWAIACALILPTFLKG